MKRLLLTIIFILLFVCTASATVYQRSDAAFRYSTGGQVLVSSLAQVWVYNTGTTTLATLYSDSTGSTILPQPVVADRYGNYSYYAQQGFYDETIIGPTGTVGVNRIGVAVGTNIALTPNNQLGYLDSQTFPTLLAADAAAVATGKTLMVTTKYAITSNTTLSAPISIPSTTGGFIISSGLTLTINKLESTVTGTVFSCTTYTCVYISSGGVKEVIPEMWGALGDNTTDDYLPLQAAIHTGIGRIVRFSDKWYYSSKALDATNRLATPTTWIGAGYSIADNNGTPTGGTVIRVQSAADGTLSPGWIADFSGSQFVTIRDINFYSTGTNHATRGLLFARTTVGAFSHDINLERINVSVPHDAAANGGNGTFAIVNNEAEMFHAKDFFLYADLPFAGTLANELSVSSPYSTIGNTPSLVNLEFENCWFFSHMQTPVLLVGAANVKFTNALFASDAAGAANLYAVTLRASASGYQQPQNIYIQGQADASIGHAVSIEGSARTIDIDMTLTNQAGAYVNLASGITVGDLRVNIGRINGGTGYSVLSAQGAMNLALGRVTVYFGDSVDLTNITTKGTRFYGIGTDLNTSITNVSTSCIHELHDTYRHTFVGGAVIPKNVQLPAWGTTIAINAASGNTFIYSATSATATIVAPASPIDGQSIQIWVDNQSGGVAGPLSFATGTDGFRPQTTWTQPANGYHRKIQFTYSLSRRVWSEDWRSVGDILD